MIRIPLALAGALLLTAAAPGPSFDPLAFFTGPSRGEGSLKVVMKASVPIRVRSMGTADGRGGIILDQTINEGQKPARQRRWTLRATSPTTFTGTITGTPGPVKGRVEGDTMHLSYMMKGGLAAEQKLTLQPGGRTVVNQMTVRKLGLPVARVREVITKTD